MKYTTEEVVQYTQEEDVKFIRLAFCDAFGNQKNIAIMPEELQRAFEKGFTFKAPASLGSGDFDELLLHPDPETLMPLPWRPEHGRVVQMYSSITYPDNSPFSYDTRTLLINAVAEAKKLNQEFIFGVKQKFYLFQLDENGKPTKIPNDEADLMAIAPEDRSENVRREICLTLEQMGIRPECSYHETGPGQNQIIFRESDPLTTADSVMTFQRVVKTIAFRNGLFADFSPLPLEGEAGNEFFINITCNNVKQVSSGILRNIPSMTLFIVPSKEIQRRNDIFNANTEDNFFELLSPDSTANPYLVFMLMIYAGLDGIKNKQSTLSDNKIPTSFEEATKIATTSEFIKAHVPNQILTTYSKR